MPEPRAVQGVPSCLIPSNKGTINQKVYYFCLNDFTKL